jgi:hypothetical protein
MLSSQKSSYYVYKCARENYYPCYCMCLGKTADFIILMCVIRLLAVKEQETHNKFEALRIVASVRENMRHILRIILNS